MKKQLSFTLAGLLAATMLTPMASANTSLTTQQKYEVLASQNIFTGYEDGTSRLQNLMTRAEFARVVSMALKLDLNNPPATASFDDVRRGHWAYEEVEAAVRAGIISGVGNNRFIPAEQVTIQEMARVLVDAKKLPVDRNAPTNNRKVAAWAAGYVDAALKAGLISTNITDFTAPATRSQLVEAAYAAFQAPAVMVSDIRAVNGVITLTLSGEVSQIGPGDFSVIQQETVKNTATVLPISSVSLAGDKRTVTLNVPVVAAGKDNQNIQYTVSYKGTAARTSAGFLVASTGDSTAPNVTGVKLVNNTRIEVTFSENVNRNSAVDIRNYTLKKADGSTVQIRSIAQVGNSNTYALTLPELAAGNYQLTAGIGIKDASKNANPLVPYSVTITVQQAQEDRTAPTVTGVKLVNNSRIEVTFSESVNRNTAVDVRNYTLKKADGSTVQINSIAQVGTSNTYALTVPELAGGNYQLTAGIGIKDASANANALTAYSTTLNVPAPNTVNKRPTVGNIVLSSDRKRLYISFSEPMMTSGDHSVVDANNYRTSDKDNKQSGLPSGSTLSFKDNVVTILLGSALPESQINLVVLRAADTSGLTVDGQPSVRIAET